MSNSPIPDSTMMRTPLVLTHLWDRAGKLFSRVPIVSRMPDQSIRHSSYGDFHRRARALAVALQHAGLKKGDRVATLMWNSQTHLEAYYGIPLAGGVLHTLNIRLHPDELAYIANHAGDRFLILDDVLTPTFGQFRHLLKIEKVIVVNTGTGANPSVGEDYESFLDGSSSAELTPPDLDEHDAAAMCYTSGTTGLPKGVVYSHRSLILHTLALCMADTFGISRRDTVMPVMSMFHANAWGVPFTSVLCGSRLVFPGRNVEAASLLDIMESQQVTFTGAVPTIWLSVMEALEKEPTRWKLSPELRIAIAGSAAPESLIRKYDERGIRMIHFWGLTETSPAATNCRSDREMDQLPPDEHYAARGRQGLAAPLVDLRVHDEAGQEVPWDGVSRGEVHLRGPWVASAYHKTPDTSDKWTEDGWFRTGDVVNIDQHGSIKIVDRTKDMIKSGGEWISSVDLENALVAHPAVREAAVVGVPHPKWAERPLAAIVLKPGITAAPDELRNFLGATFAKWQLPDAFVFVDELPHTSTGKLLKSALRETYKDWKWEK